MIVKVQPTPPGLPRAYTVVCIVEVKRADDSPSQAESQMAGYMRRVFEHGSLSDDFRGYLVKGKDVEVYGRPPYAGHGPAIPFAHNLVNFSMLDNNDPFTRELSQISVNNWNM